MLRSVRLLAHHLTPEQNIALIRNVGRSCRRFIIHDLIRHPLPLVLFTLFICPLIGREAAVDGRQSIRRAFTPDEFANWCGRRFRERMLTSRRTYLVSCRVRLLIFGSSKCQQPIWMISR